MINLKKQTKCDAGSQNMAEQVFRTRRLPGCTCKRHLPNFLVQYLLVVHLCPGNKQKARGHSLAPENKSLWHEIFQVQLFPLQAGSQYVAFLMFSLQQHRHYVQLSSRNIAKEIKNSYLKSPKKVCICL